MKNVYEVLTLKELHLFYGLEIATNERMFDILHKIAKEGLDIYSEIETMSLYKHLYMEHAQREFMIKKHINQKHFKYYKRFE